MNTSTCGQATSNETSILHQRITDLENAFFTLCNHLKVGVHKNFETHKVYDFSKMEPGAGIGVQLPQSGPDTSTNPLL